MFCIRTPVHIGIMPQDVVPVYCSGMRSVLEEACPVWNPGLTEGLSEEIECI